MSSELTRSATTGPGARRTGRAPLLVPAPQAWGGRANVRGLRVRVADDGALVVERPGGGAERRAAPGEVTRVVFVADPADVGVRPTPYGTGSVPSDALGLLVVLAGERPVLTVRVAEWVPAPAELDARAARAVSGANALAAAYGRAVEPADVAALAARGAEVRAALVSPWPTVPAAYRAVFWAGWAAVGAWFAASAVLRTGALDWLGAAGALALVGGWLLLRRQASGPLPPPPGRAVAPAPAGAATRALTRSRLYASPQWLVVADGVGREAWLPGPALGGVTSAAVTTEAVVLDDADGTGLAALPRAAWCGTPEAERALRAALAEAGLAVRDEPSNRAPGAWLAGPVQARPIDSPAFAGLREPRGVPRLPGVAGGVAGAILAVGGLAGDAPGPAVAGAVAALAALAAGVAILSTGRRDAP